MTKNQEKLLTEKFIRPMVRKALFETRKKRKIIKEEYDSDGSIYDNLQSKLWESFDKFVNAWAQKAVKSLKAYAAKVGEDEVDEEQLIAEFFEAFEAYNMWDELTSKYR